MNVHTESVAQAACPTYRLAGAWRVENNASPSRPLFLFRSARLPALMCGPVSSLTGGVWGVLVVADPDKSSGIFDQEDFEFFK